MIIASALAVPLAAILAAGLAYVISMIVVSKSLLPDQPNARSSHQIATPRAGGFAIVGGFAAAMTLLIVLKGANAETAGYIKAIGLGFGAFAFGAMDDMRVIGARLKFIFQVVIALGFIAVFGPVAQIPAPFVGEIDLGVAAVPLTAFWIVAFMNAFNFMDGINGIAGACALFFLSAFAVTAAGGVVWAAPAIVLAAALFGYLPLNFGEGRLFMGDCGSQFIGFMIAALAVLAGNGADAPVSRMFAPIAFLPFIVDVAFTLAHRLQRGRNVFQAHNEHIYQLLVRLGRSHQFVATLYLTLTVLSSSIAIFVNSRPAGIQYAAALTLMLGFAAFSFAVYRRAERAGLLRAEEIKQAPPPLEEPAQFPAAAE